MGFGVSLDAFVTFSRNPLNRVGESSVDDALSEVSALLLMRQIRD